MQVLIDAQALDNAVTYLRSRTSLRPELALVLGSGLGEFASLLVDPIEVPSSAIPSYPTSTVEGHEGKLVFGTLTQNGRTSLPLLVLKGRVHFYESGDVDLTTFPVRIAHALGAKILLVTNAAGGINRSFAEGDLMLIQDFINLSFLLPRLENKEKGSSPYQPRVADYLDKQLSLVVLEAATALGQALQQGTYCYLRGPSYETKAEIEMLHRLGADAVGMSTVPEIMVASSLGMRTAAISLISNLAAGLGDERLSHKEVAETASRVKQVFSALMTETILRIQN
jgi:purine-nucleoside phosphorylase